MALTEDVAAEAVTRVAEAATRAAEAAILVATKIEEAAVAADMAEAMKTEADMGAAAVVVEDIQVVVSLAKLLLTRIHGRNLRIK